MKGRQGSLFESSALVVGRDDSLLLQFKQYLRDLASQWYASSHQAGLVLGMIMGDRSLISKTYYQQFIDSGLVHVIAVS